MSTLTNPIGRISAFVRWVARTPWPVFTLGMVQSDIIGALFVLGFLRFGLPAEDRIQLQDLPAVNLAVFLGYLFVAFTVGATSVCGCCFRSSVGSGATPCSPTGGIRPSPGWPASAR